MIPGAAWVWRKNGPLEGARRATGRGPFLRSRFSFGRSGHRFQAAPGGRAPHPAQLLFNAPFEREGIECDAQGLEPGQLLGLG